MRVSPDGMDLIRAFEGCRLEAYQDQVGVWTIGYGHTLSVKKGDVWTQAQAEKILIAEVDQYGEAVQRMVTVPVNQHEFDALVSLAYNIGLGNFRGSTLLRQLNAGSKDRAARQFTVWNRAGGEFSRGLLERRTSEMLAFCAGRYSCH